MPVLFIARHGNTFDKGDTPTRIGRRTDLPLSMSGQRQAARLGAYFSERGIAFSEIYSAPLKRAMETAEAVVANAVRPCHIASERSLLEIDYGPDENQPEANVIDRIGQDALNQWNRASVPPPDWQVDPEALTDGWRSLFSRIRTMPSDASLLAVTSNGVARFALDAASNAKPDFPKKLRTGGFGRVEIDDDHAVVAEWDVRP